MKAIIIYLLLIVFAMNLKAQKQDISFYSQIEIDLYQPYFDAKVSDFFKHFNLPFPKFSSEFIIKKVPNIFKLDMIIKISNDELIFMSSNYCNNYRILNQNDSIIEFESKWRIMAEKLAISNRESFLYYFKLEKNDSFEIWYDQSVYHKPDYFVCKGKILKKVENFNIVDCLLNSK